MWQRVAVSLFSALTVAVVAAAPASREAPEMAAVAVNQLAVAGNACGPAALLNAFSSGDKNWQRASIAIVGKNDRERILTVIREIAMRPSKHVPGRARWSKRGISIADLCDVANEMCAGKYLPIISQEVFFLQPKETPNALLSRVHQRLDTSLAKGLPPILSIRRYALRAGQWIVIDAHFVTVTSLPRKLEKGAHSFSISYIDPWGAKRCNGEISIPEISVFPDANGRTSCLEAVFPEASVGKKLIRSGEKSMIVLSAGLGRW